MFNSCITTDTVVLFSHSIMDFKSVTVYPFEELEKPMSVMPLIMTAIKWDSFFDDASSITFQLKDI